MQLHVMQCTILRRSFCPSVRPSDKRVHCDKTKESSPQILREASYPLILRPLFLLLGPPSLWVYGAKLESRVKQHGEYKQTASTP